MKSWRRGVAAAITVFWLAMMALLARHHVLPHRADAGLLEITPALLTEQWRDYEEWMKLIIGGRPAGISYTVVRQRPSEIGYLAGNRTWLDLEVWGSRHQFRLETVALLDPSFHLHRVNADVRLDDLPLRFAALARPPALRYRWQLGDEVRTGSQPLEEPISLLEAVRPLVAQRLTLKVGDVYRLPVLDSTWSLRQGTAEVRVEAVDRISVGSQSVEAFRLVTQLGTYGSTTWVGRDGEILRRAFANIVMERVDAQEAKERFPDIDAPFEIPPLKVSDFVREGGESVGEGERVEPMTLLIELFRQPGR